MKQRKKIVGRIKKLMEMVEGGTINEKEIAIYQAQKLVAKHHIQEYELKTLDKDNVVHITSTLNARKNTWKLLGDIISKNFRCELYYNHPSHTHVNLVFVGHETDALVAKEVYESSYKFAVNEAQRLASYYYYHYGSAKGVRDEWIVGFINGLKQGFEDQVKRSSETGLMIIIPPEVKEEYNNMTWTDIEYHQLEIQRNGDEDIYRAGFNNGYDFSQGRKQREIE